jgi:DNA repair and recombination RAD54-like protein
MLRKHPTTADGRIVDKLVESVRVNLPFKAPTLARTTDKPQRKRKRVSYAEKGAADSGDDSDDDNGRKKKKKKSDGEYTEAPDNRSLIANFPVFKPKPFSNLHTTGRRFSIPLMKDKAGKEFQHATSGISLGLKVQPVILPRPLHDPMADHAIVLYDPTIDDKETEEEKMERLKEEEKRKAEEESREKTKGLFNPHKSLRDMLGESGKGDKDKAKAKKVPVVIDPVLSKVLRPHQVEGVKVCICRSFASGY